MAAKMPPAITLTTDFGNRDPWVAAMKGVISRIAPRSPIIDLSHGIAPQNLLEGALFMASAVPWFPPGTVHLAVIDPGVGTDRQAIAARCNGQYIVCPDNGLLTVLAQAHPIESVRSIANPAYRLAECSATFHGRDVFAPAAAHLAAGADFDTFGPPVDTPQRIRVPEATMDADDQLHGEVIHVDRFGNCITNINQEMVGDRTDYRVQVAAQTLSPIHRTYGDVPPGTPLALFGSTGHLEIAAAMGNAARTLQLGPGAPVTLYRPADGERRP